MLVEAPKPFIADRAAQDATEALRNDIIAEADDLARAAAIRLVRPHADIPYVRAALAKYAGIEKPKKTNNLDDEAFESQLRAFHDVVDSPDMIDRGKVLLVDRLMELNNDDPPSVYDAIMILVGPSEVELSTVEV